MLRKVRAAHADGKQLTRAKEVASGCSSKQNLASNPRLFTGSFCKGCVHPRSGRLTQECQSLVAQRKWFDACPLPSARPKQSQRTRLSRGFHGIRFAMFITFGQAELSARVSERNYLQWLARQDRNPLSARILVPSVYPTGICSCSSSPCPCGAPPRTCSWPRSQDAV